MDNYNLFDVFAKTADQLLQDVDLSPAMVYMVDTVNADALPFLASQFDVQGFRGWYGATTEAQRRELIKSAIAIKRHLGTPYAIKRALLAIGFDKVLITEGYLGGADIFYDGTVSYDGSLYYGGGSWAFFTVTISVPDLTAITDEMELLVHDLIIYYKNARSVLYDTIYRDDDLHYYDATNTYDGTITYS
jgi:phage tail P2-like protein